MKFPSVVFVVLATFEVEDRVGMDVDTGGRDDGPGCSHGRLSFVGVSVSPGLSKLVPPVGLARICLYAFINVSINIAHLIGK